ncbi:hypothetical protein LCGC14_0872030 [marine sediment metagenome]|uniref:peptidyl-tRNA hydrolase n=1 Tax=marine sediment metagenome TaxID=412755 RepID=A0A0F9RP30_9ZZZZ
MSNNKLKKKKHMKMYILTRKSISLGHQANCIGHVVLACYLKFQDHPDIKDWMEYSYRKVTCQVSDEEFEEAKTLCEDWVAMEENDLDGAEVAIAFRPREKFPKKFEEYQLFGS